MKRGWKIQMTTTRIIALGFLIGIFLGGFLLWLPVSSKAGQTISFVDALFVATTSLCVTGLTPVVMAEQWSLFGQGVVLLLMQFGGLGVVTFTTTVLLLLGRRITLSERLLIQDAYNLDSVSGVVELTKRIMKGTFLIEGLGAIAYSTVFIPEFGVITGIWKSIFHAVSAFCNAGLDLIGPSGFIVYQTDVIINVTTMCLIVVAGIGFPVWWDFVNAFRKIIKKELRFSDAVGRLNLHSKLALSVTIALIFGGAFLFLIFEYNNPATIGALSFPKKLLASCFESVTLRTAGFQTIAQENLTEASTLLALVLMFIGGSPSGTAGGVKTVTIMLLILSAAAAVKGSHEVTAFHRKISDNFVRRAMAVVAVSFAFLLASCMLLTITEDGDLIDIVFESVSALATVGLTRGFTGSLSMIGKIIIIVTMYIGRTGPITMALAFNAKKYAGKKSLAEGKVIIG